MINFLFQKKSYIKYDNRNSQWNDGWVEVYVKGELKELISVDDYRSEIDGERMNVYDIIDLMKSKYGIDKVIEDVHNWR